jgi:hypothetical protein
MRNTTPDSIGMAIKRTLLEQAVQADPESDDFEHWLLERCMTLDAASGPVRAMALAIFEEWQLALRSPEFRRWLQDGAPSSDLEPDSCPSAATET